MWRFTLIALFIWSPIALTRQLQIKISPWIANCTNQKSYTCQVPQPQGFPQSATLLLPPPLRPGESQMLQAEFRFAESQVLQKVYTVQPRDPKTPLYLNLQIELSALGRAFCASSPRIDGPLDEDIELVPLICAIDDESVLSIFQFLNGNSIAYKRRGVTAQYFLKKDSILRE